MNRYRILVLAALLLGGCEAADDSAETSSPADGQVTLAPVDLDLLVTGCQAGDMQACDSLTAGAPSGSTEFTTGATCGGRLTDPLGGCLDRLGSAEAVYAADTQTAVTNVLGLSDEIIDAHERWDAEEALLDGDPRTELYDATERSFESVAAALAEIAEDLATMSVPETSASSHAELVDVVADLSVAADDMLDGLQLPRNSEPLPGTARRAAFTDYQDAHTRLLMLDTGAALNPDQVYESAADATLEEASAVAAAVVDAHDRWETTEASLEGAERSELYAATDQDLEQAVIELGRIRAELSVLTVPDDRTADHDALLMTITDMERTALETLDGLRLRRSDEEIPGTIRREAFEEFEMVIIDLGIEG